MSSQNPDLAAIAKMADDVLALWKFPDTTTQEFQQAAQQWVEQTQAAIKALGKSEEVKGLISNFDLTPETTAILLYILLPYLNSQYHDFFEHFSTQKNSALPNAGLLTTLACTNKADKAKLDEQLDEDNPLFYWGLLIAQGNGPFHQRAITPGKSLKLHFAQDRMIDADPKKITHFVSNAEIDLPFDAVSQPPTSHIIAIAGGFSVRRVSFAFKLAQSASKPLFALDGRHLLDSTNPEEDLKQVLLFLALCNGMLYWPEGATAIEKKPSFQPILRHWFELPHTQLLLGDDQEFRLPDSLSRVSTQSFALKQLSPDQEPILWQATAKSTFGVTPTLDYKSLASRYYPDFDRIHHTLQHVKQSIGSKEVKLEDIYDSYRATSPAALANTAFLKESKASFADMSLTTTVKKKLDQSAALFLQNKQQGSQNLGFIILLEGAKGNGKSMAAECLGNALALPLYIVDHASLVQEAHTAPGTLQGFFETAEQHSACLILDDIDSLFHRRRSTSKTEQSVITSIKGEMEKYQGLIIATSSQKPVLDKGFLSVIRQIVQFGTMPPRQQFAVFGKLLKKHNASLDQKINLGRLVRVLGANGKEIRNIIENAIGMAKAGKSPENELIIGAKHLWNAIANERKKLF